MGAKLGMFEGIALPTVVYGREAWILNARSRKYIEEHEIY